jgi:ABC-2 type transport system permease protein
VTSARVFFFGGLISYRALFGWLSPWVFIPTLVIAPIFQILLFVYIGRSARLGSDEFYVIGNAIQYASIPCLFAMTQTIAGERYQQTLPFILITPAKRLPLFLGRALPVVANGSLVAALALVLGGSIVGVDLPASTWAQVALAAVVSAASCTGLGLVNAACGFLARNTAVFSNIVFGILLVSTGANVPLHELPGWLSTMAQGLPMTHGIEATRRLAGGAGLADVAGLLAAEAVVGLAYGAAGYALIRALERQSRRHATLERA